MKKKRIQFDISNKDADALEELVQESGAASMAEVLRNALNLYKYCIQETKKGGRIQIVDSGNIIKEPILPGLSHW
jgi:Arc/MetJ-type ribon-helix-helix transcriptional regulator